MKHLGLNIHRLHPDAGNPREVAFSQQWIKENKQGQVLAYILSRDNRPTDLSARDVIVAATVIQWLGSNVGMSFIIESAIRSKEIREYLTSELQRIKGKA